jgi:cob(I)alamin adenosyltransferase
MKIYTKTGDDGTTSLFDGTRVGKDDARVGAYGDVDELNSYLGLARAQNKDSEIDAWLYEIQKNLFALGAQLANPAQKKQKAKSDFGSDKVLQLESWIDTIQAQLPPLTGFILPGGSLVGASLNVARSICRRAERLAVALSKNQALDELCVTYLNRLSDYLFVLSRLANQRLGIKDIPWI